jgi:exosome complex component RRP41
VGPLVGRAFEAAAITQLYPNSQIDVHVTVLAADGGVLPCCINAVTLALVDAGIPMRDLVCACSAGRAGDALLLDVSSREDGMGVEMPVAILPMSGRVVLCEMYSRLSSVEDFQQVYELAVQGAENVASFMRVQLSERVNYLMSSGNLGEEVVTKREGDGNSNNNRMDEDD